MKNKNFIVINTPKKFTVECDDCAYLLTLYGTACPECDGTNRATYEDRIQKND